MQQPSEHRSHQPVHICVCSALTVFTLSVLMATQQRLSGGVRVQGVRPQEVVRMYDGLGQACKELKDVAAQIGGANGELLLDEASAKVCGGLIPLHSPLLCHLPVHSWDESNSPTPPLPGIAANKLLRNGFKGMHQFRAGLEASLCIWATCLGLSATWNHSF